MRWNQCWASCGILTQNTWNSSLILILHQLGIWLINWCHDQTPTSFKVESICLTPHGHEPFLELITYCPRTVVVILQGSYYSPGNFLCCCIVFQNQATMTITAWEIDTVVLHSVGDRNLMKVWPKNRVITDCSWGKSTGTVLPHGVCQTMDCTMCSKPITHFSNNSDSECLQWVNISCVGISRCITDTLKCTHTHTHTLVINSWAGLVVPFCTTKHLHLYQITHGINSVPPERLFSRITSFNLPDDLACTK